jgi:hypothetical protein
MIGRRQSDYCGGIVPVDRVDVLSYDIEVT